MLHSEEFTYRHLRSNQVQVIEVPIRFRRIRTHGVVHTRDLDVISPQRQLALAEGGAIPHKSSWLYKLLHKSNVDDPANVYCSPNPRLNVTEIQQYLIWGYTDKHVDYDDDDGIEYNEYVDGAGDGYSTSSTVKSEYGQVSIPSRLASLKEVVAGLRGTAAQLVGIALQSDDTVVTVVTASSGGSSSRNSSSSRNETVRVRIEKDSGDGSNNNRLRRRSKQINEHYVDAHDYFFDAERDGHLSLDYRSTDIHAVAAGDRRGEGLQSTFPGSDERTLSKMLRGGGSHYSTGKGKSGNARVARRRNTRIRKRRKSVPSSTV